MNAHPVDGARLILQSEEDLDLAATVAYEHHIMLDGGGYPALHYRRECMLASRLVHVCDVYDALSTKRPYRDAWPSEKTLAYLEERAGTEFDPDLVAAFIRTFFANSTRRTGSLGSALAASADGVSIWPEISTRVPANGEMVPSIPNRRNRSPVTAAAAGDVPVPGGTRFSRFALVRRYRVSLGVFPSKVAAAPSARTTQPVTVIRSAGFGGSG
jgi:hypothetical protein